MTKFASGTHFRSRFINAVGAIFLGDIYKKLGRAAEARKIYDATVEKELETTGGDLHRIALFWADHNENLDEALRIARADRPKRKNTSPRHSG